MRASWLLSLGLVVALTVPSLAADKLREGNWKLSIYYSTAEIPQFIFKVEDKDGKPSADLVAPSGIRGLTVKDFSVEGRQVRLVLKTPGNAVSFDGLVAAKDDSKVLGALDAGGRVFAAALTFTKLKSLEGEEAHPLDVPGLARIQELTSEPTQLRFKAREAKDADEKHKLQEQAREAQQKAQKELPGLYQEILDKHPDSPAVFEVAPALLRLLGHDKGDADQVKKAAAAAEKAAAAFGPIWERQMLLKLVPALAATEAGKELAVQDAERANKMLSEDASPAQRENALAVLEYAQRRAGQTEAAQKTTSQLGELQARLDKEYLSKVPPFKPTSFTGKGKRTVVLELFTGAQCPPCVAADVAFDGLEKTYQPSELVLLQYHEHIPGPDPLTNPDSEARMEYYSTAYPDDIGGTPSILLDGKPLPENQAGGGPLAASEEKYNQYRESIDKELQKPAGAKLTASATQHGEKIEIQVKVEGLEGPGEKKRLRLAVVEETIHYMGGNQIRLHHCVVRSMPGGTEGLACEEKDSTHKVSVNLKELRQSLADYLAEYARDQQAFPNVTQPLELKKLHVVAFVQDDRTHQIVQGVQVEIEGEKESQ